MATFAKDVTPISELYSHLNGYCGEHEALDVCMKRVRDLVEELLPLPTIGTNCIGPEPHRPDCTTAKRGVELKEG